MTAVAARIRALPERLGRGTAIALAVIAVLGLGLRAYAVVHPVANPADDSHAYYALAKSMYEEGSYGGPDFRDSSDWSPGAPLLYAAAFVVTGGPREGTARIVEALMGTAAILVVFALGARLADGGRDRREPGGGRAGPSAVAGDPPPLSPLARRTGLLAALGVAVYPAFIHSTGELMSEPPAILTLPAAILAFLWAGERGANPWRWLLPGFLFGLTAMFRPEYLVVAVAFVVFAAIRLYLARGARAALAAAGLTLAAVLVTVVPWTIRNVVVLDRVVPISTGSGKALYVGTYLPADGEYERVKARLVEKTFGLGAFFPLSKEELAAVDPTPLFDEVANEYKAEHGEPDLPRDSALGRLGKENFSKYFGEDPLGYLGMTARKVGRMWSSGVGAAMSSTPGRVAQLLLVAAGLAGFGLLGARRRWWELTSLATPIVLVTAVGAISLAAPRRNEVLMTLVFPLAALALSSAVSALSSSGPEWSPQQASSPPN